MDISTEFFFDDECRDIDVLRVRRRIRDDSNSLELPCTKFVSYFRLSKEAFCYLLDDIKDHLRISVRGSSIPPILKLCAALRFFAEGSYQKCCGNDFNIGLAQSTVSVVLKEMLDVIEQRVCGKWIKAKMSDAEKAASKFAFYSKTGFPGVFGCIDGTHVRIISPRKDLQHLYLNRKGYYSLNVMIVCDHKMVIRYVDARHPGANHDALIFNLSHFKVHLQRDTPENSWILGDAGYPLHPYLMTPFRATETDSPEARYNTTHAKSRNIVERTIGVLKSRFRCLLSSRGLHYSPEKATQIVNACCALHNISQHFKVELTDELPYTESESSSSEYEHIEAEEDSGVARSIRNNIMRSL